jgi:hypothetical protein
MLDIRKFLQVRSDNVEGDLASKCQVRVDLCYLELNAFRRGQIANHADLLSFRLSHYTSSLPPNHLAGAAYLDSWLLATVGCPCWISDL